MTEPECAPFKRSAVETSGSERTRSGSANHPLHYGADAVALVGMACRFPNDANDPAAYWKMLVSGSDAIDRVPPDRWPAEAFHAGQSGIPGKTTLNSGGFISDIDQFDADFFGIAPREARSMDPQHRIALELVWHAIEDANIRPSDLASTRTGVFLGLSSFDYYYRFIRKPIDELDAYTGIGNSVGVAAGRISYILGLEGPSLVVDTTCSSALVAIHLACASLQSGECENALAGGVNILLSPRPSVMASQANMLSPTNRCHAFDAAADGFVRGEGGGMLLLKLLSKAIADGDPIHGVIAGTATNQDGASFGLTVPNGPAQQRVIRAALDRAGVAPKDVGYIETHGTGTALGDPIEVGALKKVFGGERAEDRPLLIGSVKTNIGHLEAAAGVAGLMKTILAVKHGIVPPSLNFTTPNPRINWAESGIRVVTAPEQWPTAGPRIAGVSSFGFSGTNAHAVVCEAPALKPFNERNQAGERTIFLSAKSQASLQDLSARFGDKLLDENSAFSSNDFSHFCEVASTIRSSFAYRLAVGGPNAIDMGNALKSFAAGGKFNGATGQCYERKASTTCFLFPGHGSIYPGMAADLFETHETFRSAFSDACEIASDQLHLPLLKLIFEREDQLTSTAIAQPAIVCLASALTAMWRFEGVEAEHFLGHSVGEIAAASAAGAIAWEDAIRFAVARGRAMEACSEGTMLAVHGLNDHEAYAVADHNDVEIGAFNGQAWTTFAGRPDSIQKTADDDRLAGKMIVPLKVNRAFHSRFIEPALDQIAEAASAMVPKVDSRPWISNLSGEPVHAADLDWPDYWKQHARKPVRFGCGATTVQESGCNLFVEIGAQPTLAGLIKPSDETEFVPSLRRDQSDHQVHLTGLAKLFTVGVELRQVKRRDAVRRDLIRLPPYPFQRERHWVDFDSEGDQELGTSAKRLPLFDRKLVKFDLPQATASSREKRWLLCGEGDEEANLAQILSSQGVQCTTRPIDAIIGGELNAQDFDVILVLLPNLNAASQDVGSDQRELASAFAKLAGLTAIQLSQDRARTRIMVVTSNGSTAESAGYRSAVAAMVRTARREATDADWTLIDLQSSRLRENEASIFLALSAAEISEVEVKDNDLFSPFLSRRESSSGVEEECRIEGTFLVTGATGAIGKKIAAWLADRGASKVMLNAREGSGEKMAAVVSEVQQAGAIATVCAGDIASEATVSKLREKLTDTDELKGIFHCAGMLGDGMMANQTHQAFDQVANAKVSGTINLHRFSANMDLEYFVCFSSLAAAVGPPGQAVYAGANAFMDGLISERHRAGLAGHSIAWGPWDGEGMVAELTAAQKHRWERHGVRCMAPSLALEALGKVMRSNEPDTVVADVEWDEEALADGINVGDVLTDTIQPSGARQSALARLEKLASDMLEASGTALDDAGTAYLGPLLAEILGKPGDWKPDDELYLSDLGFDSLMTVELKRFVEQQLGITVPLAELMSPLSIIDVASLITRHVRLARISDTQTTEESGGVATEVLL